MAGQTMQSLHENEKKNNDLQNTTHKFND